MFFVLLFSIFMVFFFFNDSSMDCMARILYTLYIPTVAADESPTLFRLKLTDVGQDYTESTLIFT